MCRSSKSKIRTLALMILTLSMIASMSVMAFALDLDRTGSLLVQPQYDGEDVVGGSFNIYKIAEIKSMSPLTYELVAPFNQSDIDINDVRTASAIAEATTTLLQYTDEVEEADVITANGGELINNMSLGIYLVVNTDIGGNYIEASPFLSYMPMFEEGEWIYYYAAYPKLGYDTPGEGPGDGPGDPPGDGPGGGPGSSTSTTTIPGEQTPLGVTTPETVALDPEQIPQAYNPVTPEENVTVLPDEVPLSAPQTGMLQWPVPVLGALGCALTGSGIIVGREKKENEE